MPERRGNRAGVSPLIEQSTVARENGRPVGEPARASIGVPPLPLNILTKSALVLFVISVALENTASALIPLPTSLPTLAGGALLTAYVLWFPRQRSGTKPERPFRWLLLFALVTGLGELARLAIFGASPGVEHVDTALMYAKLGVTFYVLDRIVAQSAHAYRLVVYSWVGILAGLAFMAVARIDLVVLDHGGRVGLVGENLNVAGHRWAGVAVGVMAVTLRGRGFLRRAHLVLYPLLAVLVLATFQSGSRGATVALALGLAASLLAHEKLTPGKIAKFAAVGGLIGLGLYEAYSSTVILRSRWQDVVEGGDATPRSRILMGSIDLIRENPIVGYGSGYYLLLGARLERRPVVSHNAFTQVMLTTGILGFVPFAAAIAGCLRRASLRLTNPLNIAVFGVLCAALVSCMFANWVHLKYFWLVLVLATNAPVLALERRTRTARQEGGGLRKGAGSETYKEAWGPGGRVQADRAGRLRGR